MCSNGFRWSRKIFRGHLLYSFVLTVNNNSNSNLPRDVMRVEIAIKKFHYSGHTQLENDEILRIRRKISLARVGSGCDAMDILEKLDFTPFRFGGVGENEKRRQNRFNFEGN